MAKKPSPRSAADKRRIWKAFASAIGAELRPATTIQGVSGLNHNIQALAVDDKLKRVVVVASEANARTAALMQVDIQATLPDAKVLVARPVVFDIADIARRVLGPLPINPINLDDLKQISVAINQMEETQRNEVVSAYMDKALNPLLSITSKVTLPALNQVLDVIGQMALLPWPQIIAALTHGGNGDRLDLKALTAIDNIEIDRRVGVCAVPLYEFSEQDWDLFLSGRRTEEIQRRLKALGIYQYFFPPPDQLALGLVANGIKEPTRLVPAVAQAPQMGHPFGELELLKSPTGLADTLAALKDLGYVAEGEFGVEVTPEGQTVRSAVKFRPRESTISKILNRLNISLSVSPKDFGGH